MRAPVHCSRLTFTLCVYYDTVTPSHLNSDTFTLSIHYTALHQLADHLLRDLNGYNDHHTTVAGAGGTDEGAEGRWQGKGATVFEPEVAGEGRRTAEGRRHVGGGGGGGGEQREQNRHRGQSGQREWAEAEGTPRPLGGRRHAPPPNLVGGAIVRELAARGVSLAGVPECAQQCGAGRGVSRTGTGSTSDATSSGMGGAGGDVDDADDSDDSDDADDADIAGSVLEEGGGSFFHYTPVKNKQKLRTSRRRGRAVRRAAKAAAGAEQQAEPAGQGKAGRARRARNQAGRAEKAAG